jgi:hypothetical protein
MNKELRRRRATIGAVAPLQIGQPNTDRPKAPSSATTPRQPQADEAPPPEDLPTPSRASHHS